MNLQPVPRAAISACFEKKLGAFHLGFCYIVLSRSKGTCGNFVNDDGMGYADLDGPPFRAYVCHECYVRINQGE